MLIEIISRQSHIAKNDSFFIKRHKKPGCLGIFYVK